MKPVLIGGAVVALALALFGAYGPSEGTPVPLRSATPGAPCTTPGPLGVVGDSVYECVGAHWRRLR